MNLPGSHRSAARWSLSQSNGSRPVLRFGVQTLRYRVSGKSCTRSLSAGKYQKACDREDLLLRKVNNWSEIECFPAKSESLGFPGRENLKDRWLLGPAWHTSCGVKEINGNPRLARVRRDNSCYSDLKGFKAMRWMKRRIQRSRDRCQKAFKEKSKEFSRPAAGQSVPPISSTKAEAI